MSVDAVGLGRSLHRLCQHQSKMRKLAILPYEEEPECQHYYREDKDDGKDTGHKLDARLQDLQRQHDQLQRKKHEPEKQLHHFYTPANGATTAGSIAPDNPVGLRDRAIILTLILTGRRRAEVLSLKAGDLTQDGEAVYYTYRGKGGKHGKRELPQPAFRAIQQALEAYSKDFSTMEPEESLWPSSADSGRGISSGTFYGNMRRYFKVAGLRPAGVHIFRHSAARLRREAGESIEQVSRFLDHSSLAVTTVYLRQLEGDRDTAWGQVAVALGV